ncbi:D-glycero-beta-D-manno-heptose-7-phosphate kinase [Acidobacteria bacterium AH-259-O06]|nr:D-glycero-beta-D-manno-heptose-7-phosphate kinase [Acidobacteria bacterium AH-259-O06]
MISADKQQLHRIVKCFSDQPVLVVGDLMLDQFVWGKVERISPEAPVPVVEIVKESIHLGGAANVACNLAVLGARPLLVGVVGSDEAGQRLIEELHRQDISSEGVVRDSDRRTTIKTRIIAQHQQVCRTDRESNAPLSEAILERILELYQTFFDQAKGIIVSDYAKGALSGTLIEDLIQQSRRAEIFLAVDPKVGDFSIYRQASVITPNKKEAESASGVKIVDELCLIRAGQRLLEMTGARHLLITRGEEGMTLFEDDKHSHIPTVAREVFDVTGAGDTVIASLTLAVAAGASVWEAATVANHAAGVVVGKLGTAAVTVDEILSSIGNDE